jgi:hypothetical protein
MKKASIINAALTPGTKVAPTNEPLLSCTYNEIFEANQRQSTKTKCDDLGASIETKGVKTPIQVTLEPQSQKWVLSPREQTGILICRDLYESTQENRFLYPPISKNTLVGDLEACFNHVAENQLRCRNSFNETSKAVLTIRDLLIQEQMGTTQEEVADEMANRALRIHRQWIAAMTWRHLISLVITNRVLLTTIINPIIAEIRSIRQALNSIFDSGYMDSTPIEFTHHHHHRGQATCKKIKVHSQSQHAKKVNVSRSPSIGPKTPESVTKPDLMGLTAYLAAGFLVELSTAEVGHRGVTYLLGELSVALIDEAPSKRLSIRDCLAQQLPDVIWLQQLRTEPADKTLIQSK